MICFTIDWTEIRNDREFTTDYIYDGCSQQKGYDLIDWILRCAEFGRQNGFRAGKTRLKNPDDYPDFADKLFQPKNESSIK